MYSLQISTGETQVGASVDVNTRSRIQAPLALVLAVVLLDQATKAWALRTLADGPVRLIGDWADFRLAWNSGSAFSMLSGSTWFLTALGIVLLGVLIYALTRATDPINKIALALLLGGALGNLTDRFFRAPGVGQGHVVDFIRVGSWPVFNIADSAITIGVIVVMWRTWTLDSASNTQANAPVQAGAQTAPRSHRGSTTVEGQPTADLGAANSASSGPVDVAGDDVSITDPDSVTS